MRLYDTARQDVVPFEPGPVVTMYTCGITPYDATHLGHAAVYVTYDVLQLRLRDMGFDTKCVRNITDVDDSILAKARSLGVHYLDLGAAETARFDNDMAALNLLSCWSEPRATSAIPDIRGFIGMVLDRGHAYQAGGAVYFDVSSFPDFGSVSHYTRDEMLALAAERGGNVDDPNKRDPLDFVLARHSGVVSGIVTNAQNQPTIGAIVVFVPEEKLRGRADRYQRVPTDSDGRFRVTSLPPGAYTVYAFDEVSFDAVYNPEFLARYRGRGGEVIVLENQDRTLNLGLIPAEQ